MLQYLWSVGAAPSCLWSPFNIIPLVFSDKIPGPWPKPGTNYFYKDFCLPFHVCKDHVWALWVDSVLNGYVCVGTVTSPSWYLISPAVCGHLVPPSYSLSHAHVQQPVLASPPTRP